MVDMPLQRLHVSILKSSVQGIEDALRDVQTLQRFDIAPGPNFTGALFVAPPSEALPPWLEFVQAGVSGQIDGLQNRTNSAVLVLAKGRHLFAVTFGHGRYLLNQEKLVDDFGLKTALNGLKPDSLRSMDSMLIEEQTVHIKRQVSRASGVDAFGIDVGRDILRAVTGSPRPDTGFHGLSGREAIAAIAARIEFDALGDTCDRLRRIYGRDSYKQDFGWVDNVQRVKSSDELERLDRRLLARLTTAGCDGAYLAVPDMVDWADFDGFLMPRGDGQPVDALDLSAYAQTLRDSGGLEAERLKRDRLQMRRVSQPEAPLTWPIYKCLMYETELRSKRYVLSGGEWYRVAASLVEEVAAELATIPVSARQFPRVRRRRGKLEHEGDYNARVAAGDTSLRLLDKVLVKCRGAASLIEPCDLLSSTGELIHVKHGHRSSTLSHLFWQARVSAEALLADDHFRRDVRAKLSARPPSAAGWFPTERPDPSKHEIVFAILGARSPRVVDSFPFFSQLALSRTHRYLRSTGFAVSQVGVPEEP